MQHLKFIDPQPPAGKYTANAHSTGRLGFAINTAADFGIEIGKSMRLAINGEDETDKSFYAIIIDKVDEDKAYKIIKNGNYHSINAKSFFDQIGVKYADGGVPYMITQEHHADMKLLKFTQREKKAKDKETK